MTAITRFVLRMLKYQPYPVTQVLPHAHWNAPFGRTAMVARDEGTIKTMAEEGDATTTTTTTTTTTKAQPVKDRPPPSLSSFDSDAEGAVKKKGSFMITNVRQGNSGDISLLEGAEEDDDAENENETSTIAPNGPLDDDVGGGKQTRFQLVNLRESSRGRWKCLDTIPETEPPPSANGRGSPIAAPSTTNGETTTTTTMTNHLLAPSNGAPANGARALPSTTNGGGGGGAPSLFIDDVSETISSTPAVAPVFSRQTSCESENSVVGVSVTTATATTATTTTTTTVAASPSHRRDRSGFLR